MRGGSIQKIKSDQHSYTFNTKYQIGTPFEDPSQKQNFQNMKARDPSGNVRWKGAFTGGFEAGYKNTCGSKDGWTPATFVSSRANRNQSNYDIENTNQRIFEYMDDEDIGGLDITSNIQVRKQFNHINHIKNKSGTNEYDHALTHVSLHNSIGDIILKKMKQSQAQMSAPENISQLNKLLENYNQNQIIQQQFQIQKNNGHTISQLRDQSYPYYSAGCTTHPPQDQFLTIYTELFRRVIRKPVKNYQNAEDDTQQKEKQAKNNKVFFDFTKALDEQPQYLKQIRQVDEYDQQAGRKPRKRVKNVVNQNNLQSLFKCTDKKNDPKTVMDNKKNSYMEYMKKIPSDYDPYKRLKDAKKAGNKLTVDNSQKKPLHRIFSVKERSDIIGQNRFSQKLSDKFVKSGGVPMHRETTNNKFIRAGQQTSKKDNQKMMEQTQTRLEKVFQDDKKNNRFWDHIMQLQGKKICAQLEHMPFEQAEKQRRQFQQKYAQVKQARKRKEEDAVRSKQKNVKLPDQIERALGSKNVDQKEMVRKNGTWKPQKLLCKRFGCMSPFSEQQNRTGHQNKNKRGNEQSLEQPYF